jgi:hypothetical protein
MYVNIATPITGIINENVMVGIPKTKAFAGEIKTGSILFFSLLNPNNE